jgi:hypothetical protein
MDAIASKQSSTQLTSYFDRNKSFPKEAAKKYKYEKFPKHYTFDLKEKNWNPRKNLQHWQLSCMVAIHPNAFGQQLYLWLLLRNKGGVTSF